MIDDLLLLAKYTPEVLFKWKMVGADSFMPIEEFIKSLNAPQSENGPVKMQEKTHQNLTVFVIPDTEMGKFSRYMFHVDPNDAHWRDRLTREVYHSMQRYHPKKGYIGVTLQFKNEEINDGEHVRATYSAAPLKESIPASPAYGFQALGNVITSSATRRNVSPEERAQERFADYRESCATKLAANIKSKFGDRPTTRSDLKRAVISGLHCEDMMSKIRGADIKKNKIQVSSAISSDICTSIQRVDAARMKSKGIDLETAHKTAILGSAAWDCVKSWFNSYLNKPKPADENIAATHSDYSDNEDERSYRRNFNPSMVRALPTVQSVSYTATAPASSQDRASQTIQVGEQRSVFNLRQINKSDLAVHKEHRTVYLYPIQKKETKSVQAERGQEVVHLYPIQKKETKSVQAERGQEVVHLYPIQKAQATYLGAAHDEEEEIFLEPIKASLPGEPADFGTGGLKTTVKMNDVPTADYNVGVKSLDDVKKGSNLEDKTTKVDMDDVELQPLDDEDEDEDEDVNLNLNSRKVGQPLSRPISFSLINASRRRVNLTTDGISQELNMAKFVGPIRVAKSAQVDNKFIGDEHDGATLIYNGCELIKAPQTAQKGQTSMRFTNLCNDKSIQCQVKSHLGTTTMLGSSYSGMGSGAYTITISGERGAAKVDNRVVHQGNSYTVYAVPYGNRNAIVMAADCENVNTELVKQMGSVRGKEGFMFVGMDRNFGHVIKGGLRMMHSSAETSRHVAKDGRVFDVTERRNGVYDKNESIKSVIGMWHHPENPKLTVIEYNGHSSDLPLDQ